MMVRDFQTGDRQGGLEQMPRWPVASPIRDCLRRRRLQRDGDLPSLHRRTPGRAPRRRRGGGRGIDTGMHARPSLPAGRPGVLHGNRTYLLQNEDGQIIETHSISAGLDYPASAPSMPG